MGRLARGLACDASNVTGIVDRLEARGLIERRPGASDRRVKVLVITREGERLRATMLAAHGRAARGIRAALARGPAHAGANPAADGGRVRPKAGEPEKVA